MKKINNEFMVSLFFFEQYGYFNKKLIIYLDKSIYFLIILRIIMVITHVYQKLS